MWQEELSNLLREMYKLAKARNHRVSMRGFAKKIGVSHSTLLDITKNNSKWKPSERLGELILQNIDATEREKERVRAMMRAPLHRKRKTFPTSESKLLTDWTQMATLFAFDLDPELTTPERLAQRFGLSTRKVLSTISSLIAQKLLVTDPQGHIARNRGHWTTTDEIPSQVIREHHATNLHLAKRALDEIPLHERDFTSMTFVGDSENLERVKNEIRLFHERCEAILSSNQSNNEVYRLSVQLFPLKFKGEAK